MPFTMSNLKRKFILKKITRLPNCQEVKKSISFFVGAVVGAGVGGLLGGGVGLAEGATVGCLVGLRVGGEVGAGVGFGVGNGVGWLEGFAVGLVCRRARSAEATVRASADGKASASAPESGGV